MTAAGSDDAPGTALLALLGRQRPLFLDDLRTHGDALAELVSGASFLVLGGAGSIGQAVVKELFRRSPRKLHVVDLSENNLAELVRDLRSSLGYVAGDFRTFAIDIGSVEFEAFMRHDGRYDYVLNLSALKHVRSERDPFTLMRMVDVNILNTDRSIGQAVAGGARKYFCVSTDKATNPVNMMGASKRIMELFLARHGDAIDISTARFANVAFSDGSLLQGFERRIAKQQPIVAPDDVRRYFVTAREAGELCLMSALLGGDGEIFFPKDGAELKLTTFAEIALRYVAERGFEPVLCADEDEARDGARELPATGRWPVLVSTSDTTGEKAYEEFYAAGDAVVLDRFTDIGVIPDALRADTARLAAFAERIAAMKQRGAWTKEELVALFRETVPEFAHQETGSHLDGKM